MEQKTEASQAVDDLLPCPFCGAAARIESNRDWHKLRADHDESCVFDPDDYDLMYPASPGYLLEIAQVWNRRAALKAQPAPTEAQGDAVIPASVDLRLIQDETKAQGEDSARLDDLATIRELDRLGMELGVKLVRMDTTTMKGREYLYREDVMIAVTDWRNEWDKNSKARKPIDRARASAETGGVKS